MLDICLWKTVANNTIIAVMIKIPVPSIPILSEIKNPIAQIEAEIAITTDDNFDPILVFSAHDPKAATETSIAQRIQ
ncbi:hypothetical protein ACFLS9_05420 [Bacteroidota bacterium]